MPISISKATTTSSDPIIQVAERMEGKIRVAFLRAVAQLRDSIGMDDLIQAINTGDVNAAMAILGLDKRFVKILNGPSGDTGINSFRRALSDTFVAGATAAMGGLPSVVVNTTMMFNVSNPETVAFLDNYTFPLIQQISSNTADAIRDVISNAFGEGGHPFVQARKIKTFIGLTDRQSKAVLNYRNSLSNASTLGQSLTRALRDGRFDGTVNTAIRNHSGLPQSQIDKMTQRYTERYIQYRAQTIARTESIRASAKGQHALWDQARKSGLLDDGVRRMWIVSGDPATCDDCLDLDGMEVGLDEEFAPGVMDPGDVHSDCRCGQALVFPKAA